MVREDDKTLERMRCSKVGWKYTDIERLYLKYGFEKKEGGKHSLFIHPEFPELRATVARHNTIPIGYIQFAIKIIDRLKQLQEGIWEIKD